MPLVTGRLEHDPVKLAQVPKMFSFVPNKPAPPDKISRKGIVYTPRLGDNGVDPDCTTESLRECATGAAALLGGYELNVARTASLSLYCLCVGLPSNATGQQIQATDGAEMLAVAAHQWSGGGFNTGYDMLFGQYGTLDINSREELALAATIFGQSWMGITLYQKDEDSLYTSQPWDDDGSDPGDLIGRHAIACGWEYTGLGDEDEVTIVTYGLFKPTKWRWLKRRLEEAHVFYWRQLDGSELPLADINNLTSAIDQFEAQTV